MQCTTHPFFDGCCEESAASCPQAIGAEPVCMRRYNESPEPQPPGMVLPGCENGFSLSLTTKTEAEADA